VRPVPFVDLAWQHEVIEADIVEPLLSVMAKGSFINGPDVAAFESEFAAFIGVSHCVGVANGTDAIELALRAGRLEAGTAVILPANTFIATAEAVVRAGARPTLVDCDEFGLIDTDLVSSSLTPDTGAVIPVHLYGQMANMEALCRSVQGSSVQIVKWPWYRFVGSLGGHQLLSRQEPRRLRGWWGGPNRRT
jgi:dTDP-4-amino-4,6-dideoxygalactose transaminase